MRELWWVIYKVTLSESAWEGGSCQGAVCTINLPSALILKHPRQVRWTICPCLKDLQRGRLLSPSQQSILIPSHPLRYQNVSRYQAKSLHSMLAYFLLFCLLGRYWAGDQQVLCRGCYSDQRSVWNIPIFPLSTSNIISFSNLTHLAGSELLKELHSWKEHPLKSLGNSGNVVWGLLHHSFMLWEFLELFIAILCSWLNGTTSLHAHFFSLIIRCNLI